MATEKRLIDANALIAEYDRVHVGEPGKARKLMEDAPTVDAVEAKKYEALVKMYHELRENFVDYYCSGIQNVAPYCRNRCEECIDGYGWCKHNDKCHGFNPAEVILMDGDGNA